MDNSQDPPGDSHSEPEDREFGSSLELDKIAGFWVVTGWPDGDVVLRLKIRHNCNEEPIHIFCEIRIGSGTRFMPICDFESCVYDLAHPAESEPYLYDELPAIWQRNFAEMARRWAACDYLLKFGSSGLPRYAEEPVSSRDAYESGPHTFPAEDALRADQEGASEA